jgi:hypothetical protein
MIGCDLGLVFSRLNAVLFFNNLEEVKIYIEAFKRSNTRKTVQWVVIVLSTNIQCCTLIFIAAPLLRQGAKVIGTSE